MFYVGLSGKIATGKSTIAAHLQEALQKEHAIQVCRLSFGDLVKIKVGEIYGIHMGDMYDEHAKDKRIYMDSKQAESWGKQYIKPAWIEKGYCTIREVLQYFGTELTRSKDPDYWLKNVEERAMAWREGLGSETLPPFIVIIDDVRFPNELAFVRDSGIAVRIEPHEDWTEGSHAQHESETALDKAFSDNEKVYPGLGRTKEVVPAIITMMKAGGADIK